MKKKQLHKPKWLVTMLLLVRSILMPYEGAWAQTPTKPAKGNGSVDKPYEISTAAELAWFRDYVNKESQFASATLTEDIDLSEFCHAADAATNTEEPVGILSVMAGCIVERSTATGRRFAIYTSIAPL